MGKDRKTAGAKALWQAGGTVRRLVWLERASEWGLAEMRAGALWGTVRISA